MTDEMFRELLAVVTGLAQSDSGLGGGTHLLSRCDDIKTAMDERMTVAAVRQRREAAMEARPVPKDSIG